MTKATSPWIAKFLAIGTIAVAGLMAGTAVQAHGGVSLSIGVGVPGVVVGGPVYGNPYAVPAPVYVPPRPVYYAPPPPVYYAPPPPVYYAPPRPMYRPPMYRPAPVYYGGGGYRPQRHNHGHHHHR